MGNSNQINVTADDLLQVKAILDEITLIQGSKKTTAQSSTAFGILLC